MLESRARARARIVSRETMRETLGISLVPWTVIRGIVTIHT